MPKKEISKEEKESLKKGQPSAAATNKEESEIKEIEPEPFYDGPELDVKPKIKIKKSSSKIVVTEESEDDLETDDKEESGEKKKKKKKPKKDSEEKGGKRRIFVGSFIILFAVVLVLAIITFSASDTSFYVYSQSKPHNFLGKLGSYLSDFFLQWFGLTAFFIPVLLIFFSKEYFIVQKFYKRFLRFSVMTFALIFSAGFWGLLNFKIKFGGAYLKSGGGIGIIVSQKLDEYLNFWGTFFATAILATVFYFVFFKITPQEFWAQIVNLKNFFVEAIKGSKEAKAKEEVKKEKVNEVKEIKEIEESKVFAPLDLSENDKKNVLPPIEDLNEIQEEETPLEELNKKESSVLPVKTKKVETEFKLPPIDLLQKPKREKQEIDKSKLIENARLLQEKFANLGVHGEVVAYKQGPVITMYEFKPAPGIKLSKIAGLGDDLCMALSVESVRIVAPIPGKSVVGVEIPNEKRETVYLREIFENEVFNQNRIIPLGIGKDTFGQPGVTDLAKMPHLLVAGTTGSGKSVFIHDVICSLLYKFTPNEMKLIMVDPKQLELAVYEDIPHLLVPVVNDPKKAATALRGAVMEMEKRYTIMARSGMRNVEGFNQKHDELGKDKMRDLVLTEKPGQASIAGFFDIDENGLPNVEKMPYLVIIIDELADLMMVAAKEMETSIARIAQKARAAGIHLMIATQRPSVDVITGLIKANFPARISFQTTSKIDSRTILDCGGAESLIGKGDLLFMPPGIAKLQRMHAAFVSESEVEEITKFWKEQAKPNYKTEFLAQAEEPDEDDEKSTSQFADKDEFYDQAVELAREMGKMSASMLQRRFKIGYNRAARLVESMEENGVLGPADGAKPREFIYSR